MLMTGGCLDSGDHLPDNAEFSK
ncbi:hypothetical protein HKBW3S25_01901, partial [Candidatus Hakubella thermalkaliphila]